MADRDDRGDDERPGYKRPPSWGQIQKGERRNPNGRPKGTGKKQMASKQPAGMNEFQKMLSALLGEEVTLTIGGKRVSVTKMQVMLMNLYKQAMNGNAAAIRELTRLIEKLQVTQEALARANAEAAEKAAEEKAKSDAAWFEYLVELKDKQTKAWANAEAEGKDEPDEPWPHPDDILIDHAERKATVRGPWCDKDVRYFEYIEAQRDLMFLRDMIYLKRCKLSEITGMTFWELMWRLLDARLPLHWQIAHKADRYELGCLNTPLRTLRRKADEISRLVEELEPPECKVRDRKSYKFVNSVMKPLLNKMGYKSWAHFERIAGQQIAGGHSRS
jgi:Family of unknown function (DUF5681)